MSLKDRDFLRTCIGSGKIVHAFAYFSRRKCCGFGDLCYICRTENY
ncbi:hypothetical protein BACCOPRO_02439 [Phocaeicola coprophilus DSM 18228 = JCM 13818]|uniref:Uncharacterized protein n=1 Tax=Phocaeicola coprophilus DSM 18228 = JCM 13818 TaxID=547042 RepID=S0FAV0_9BACT|nr:hypothetical protein BACCOPRO_02439 [Phocaeicola coprophilus DSM 18228 = JCM 13818]